jgi:hypothetical protein
MAGIVDVLAYDRQPFDRSEVVVVSADDDQMSCELSRDKTQRESGDKRCVKY